MTTTLSAVQYDSQKKIKLLFDYQQDLTSQVKAIEGAYWSRTHQTWLLPYTKNAYEKLLLIFPCLQPPPKKWLLQRKHRKRLLHRNYTFPKMIAAMYGIRGNACFCMSRKRRSTLPSFLYYRMSFSPSSIVPGFFLTTLKTRSCFSFFFVTS